jgi:hypothetical protein
LAKLRGKTLAERIPRSRRYRATPQGVAKLTAYSILREHVIKPLLAGVVRTDQPPPKATHPIDAHYRALRSELLGAFDFLGLAAA